MYIVYLILWTLLGIEVASIQGVKWWRVFAIISTVMAITMVHKYGL